MTRPLFAILIAVMFQPEPPYIIPPRTEAPDHPPHAAPVPLISDRGWANRAPSKPPPLFIEVAFTSPPSVGEQYRCSGVQDVLCDLNGDGAFTSADFFEFFARFFSETGYDFNNDRVVSSQDYYDFQRCRPVERVVP